MITDGKWEVRTNHLPAANYTKNLIFCNGKKVASTMSSNIENTEQEDNANLIAASKPMLALLKDILGWQGILDHSKVRIQGVIDEAEGKL